MQGTVTQSSLLFCQHLNKVQGKGQRGQRLDRHRRWKAKEGGASWRSHGRTAEKDTDLEMNWIIKNMCISHAYLQTSRIWIFGDFEIRKLRVIGWKFNHTFYSNSNGISFHIFFRDGIEGTAAGLSAAGFSGEEKEPHVGGVWGFVRIVGLNYFFGLGNSFYL